MHLLLFSGDLKSETAQNVEVVALYAVCLLLRSPGHVNNDDQ